MKKMDLFDDFDVEVEDSADGVYLDVTVSVYKQSYKIIINTYKDPYTCFYENGNVPPDREQFEERLLDILEEKYPDRF